MRTALAVRATIEDEIKQVQKKNPKGLIKAEDLLAFAKNPKTELHKRFCWDDTEAARRYRLFQAKALIRVVVKVLPDKSNDLVPVIKQAPVPVVPALALKYKDLTSKLKTRGLPSTLSKPELAKAELRIWLEKFHDVEELSWVVSMIQQAKKNGQLDPA